jgi:hypothetical protein
MKFHTDNDTNGYFDGAAAQNWQKVFDLVVTMDNYRREGIIEQLGKLGGSPSPKKNKKKKKDTSKKKGVIAKEPGPINIKT